MAWLRAAPRIFFPALPAPGTGRFHGVFPADDLTRYAQGRARADVDAARADANAERAAEAVRARMAKRAVGIKASSAHGGLNPHSLLARARSREPSP